MTGAGLRGARREDQQPSLRQAVLRSEWRRRRRTARGRRRVMVLLAVAAIVADQTAKWVVRETIRRGEDGVSFSGLALGHNRNDGIAFGLFAGSGRAVGIATALALPLLAVALGLLARSRPLTAIAGGLLLGGSASNLSDRLLRGEVTDYIEVGRWPAFNLADVAIVCGVGLLAWILARGEAARSEPEVP